LTSPAFNVFTNDFDISCEKYDLATNIDTIVKITSRGRSSEVIVLNGVVYFNFTSDVVIGGDPDEIIDCVLLVRCGEDC
jgi:hypothetical protein